MSRLRIVTSRLTYANVVSTLALVGLLSGTAYAAGTITSQQIKDNTILSRDIHNGTVNSKDIKDGSIQAGDLASGAAGADYVPFGGVLAVGDYKTVHFNHFQVSVACNPNDLAIGIYPDINGSNLVLRSFKVLWADDSESHWTGRVINDNGAGIQGYWGDLVDKDVVRYEGSGITPSQDAQGTRYGVWVSMQGIYLAAGCSYMGVIMPSSL